MEWYEPASKIVVALIGLVGIIYGAKVGKQNKNLKSKAKTDIKEISQDASLVIEATIRLSNRLSHIAKKIFNASGADRFLILTATNGKKDLRHATAVYEKHLDETYNNPSYGATAKFRRLKVDRHYVNMLKLTEQYGSIELEVSKMEACDYKEILEEEGVYFSKVFFIGRYKIDELNDRMFYMSVATHNKKGFKEGSSMSLKAYIDNIRSLFEELL